MAKIFVRERNQVDKGEGLPHGTGEGIGEGSGGGQRQPRAGRRRKATDA
jgi:hypothetical protein